MKITPQPLPIATLFAAFLLLTTHAFAQTDHSKEDKSKRPSKPAKASATVGDAKVTIDYSSPSLKGRKMSADLAPYGKVWRTGANEATTFEVDKDVKVEGQPLPAGKYALFTIPGESEWTVIFNKVPNQWGAFKHDEKQDALRVKVKPKKAPKMTEMLTFDVNKSGKVAMMWENTEVDFNVASAGKASQ